MTFPPRLWLRLRLAVLLLQFLVVPALADINHPQVVILSPYYQGYDWSDKELAGLLDRLQQVYPTLDPPLEYLDTKRLPGPEQLEWMKHYLISKYRGRKVDLSSALDNLARNLAPGARHGLFTDVPVATESTASPLVDYQKLIRFAISLAASPPETAVTNRPVSLYQQHQLWIWPVSLTVIFLFLGIFILSHNIVRRRLAEKALLASETGLRSVIDCTAEAILTVYKNRIITSVNPAFTRMLGYTAAEVLGQSAALIHPSEEQFQEFGEMVYPTIAVTGSWKGEYNLKKKDGTLVPTEMSLMPQRLPDGTRMGYIGALRDISKQKQAEEALRQSEERFRLLVENAPDAILIQTAGRFAYVNKEALRLFGATRAEQLLGQTVLTRIHPAWQETVKDRMQRLNEAREAVPRMEQQYLKLDGTAFDVEVSAVPFRYRGEDGALIFVRDITERKKAEAALKEGWQLNQTLLDSLPCVAMLLRPHTREIVAANEAAAQVGAVPGAFCYATFGKRQTPCPFCRAPAAWATGQAQQLEVEALDVVWDAHWVPLQEDLYLHYALDMTARKETEMSQKMLEAQLFQAQKMEALGTLAGGIAHDFNNVLGAMIGFTELAMIELSESAAARTYLDNVLKAGERARHLVRQILSFSRREKVVQQPISLPPIVKETLRFLRASLPTTIKIRTSLQAGEAIVAADPTQIHQILLNLCTNAAHAMEENGGTLEVCLRELKVSAQEISSGYGSDKNLPPGSYLELLVGDSGHGMEPAVMERIFDPFFTTKDPWKGTGMGLAVVYGIVKTLNGEIQVTSRPGQGTTFRVLLPAAEIGPSEATPEVSLPISRGRGCILFVDDDEDFFPAGQRMLAELGYEVVAHNSSQKAWEDFAAHPHRFDLIISDLTMPGLTGLELATACLQLQPDIPIILSTGFSETVTPEKVRSAGIREMVAKPFNLCQIGEIIQNVFKEEPKRSRIRVEVIGKSLIH